MSDCQTSDRKVILELNKLKKYFPINRKVNIRALEDVSFSIYEGEKFGVVGESGCGKSTLGRVILQLYPQTGGSCVYYGKSLEEVCPQYLEEEIKKLPAYQKNAENFYQKSLEIDKQIEKLEQQGGSEEKINELRVQSKECRKDASRQLREGSRTIGSLIISGKLPEVQALFAQCHKITQSAHKQLEIYSKCEAELKKLQLENKQPPVELLDRMNTSKSAAENFSIEANKLREKAFEYRGQDIAPITERCENPEYQAKLDRNYETGVNMGKLTGKEMRMLRRDMQMIFQDPAASLDPRQSVGKAIEEVFVIHTEMKPEVRKEQAMTLLERVGLKREHYYSYPHALSGGQKQRVGIAKAIALDTKFIVLDESVSALDVSVQAQILQLLNDLCEDGKRTYFFITHDLGVVKHFCDRVLVMYLGNVCELAESGPLFHNPLHPYTKSLLASVPRPVVQDKDYEETILEGEVPSAVNPPSGCPFHTRCRECMDVCMDKKPKLKEVEENHFVACHLYNN